MALEKKKFKLVGFYNYTVILTYIGFSCSIIGIVNALTGNIKVALILLMACGFCDMFDGTVARTRERNAEEIAFGAHIDSLSDIAAFGIFPATILYGLGLKSMWGFVAMIFYALCALIRLAYFDVQEMFEIKENPNMRRTHFTGLPVTNAAIILPCIMTINLFIGIKAVYLYLVCLILVGVAFVTPFKMKKWYGAKLVIPALLGAACFVLLIIFGGSLNA